MMKTPNNKSTVATLRTIGVATVAFLLGGLLSVNDHQSAQLARQRHHEYLRNGGSLETAQEIAAHESSKTTKLYDRSHGEIILDEIERIPAV